MHYKFKRKASPVALKCSHNEGHPRILALSQMMQIFCKHYLIKFITGRNEVVAKVIFLVACVKNSVDGGRRGGGVSRGVGGVSKGMSGVSRGMVVVVCPGELACPGEGVCPAGVVCPGEGVCPGVGVVSRGVSGVSRGWGVSRGVVVFSSNVLECPCFP